jgi:hypothetical protein
MSIIEKKGDVYISTQINPKDAKKLEASSYRPSDEDKQVLNMVIDHYAKGTNILNKPRKEFDDLSVIQASKAFQLRFNTYVPNDGRGFEGDPNNWRSKAIKPVQRNKVISIAAHATARQIFPKIFATDKMNFTQDSSAKVMELLMENAANNSNYDKTFFRAVINSLVNVVSVVYSEYAEVYQNFKTERDETTGKYKIEKKLNRTYSGFQDEILLPEELLIENFYEQDIQKQGYLVKRKILSYSQAQIKYTDTDNFKYVKPGMQCLGSQDGYYYRYDDDLQSVGVEEVIYWNKSLDVRLVVLNGILVTPNDEPNPRIDKMYPFSKFGYELFGNTNCYYYKSLISKMDKDADIVNTLYRILIDGTLLSVMPPIAIAGSENTFEATAMTPGSVTTFSSADTKAQVVGPTPNLNAGFTMLAKVEESIDQSSSTPLQQGLASGGTQTAYEISKLEANAGTVLGLYTKMVSDFVLQYGELRKNDILQYQTVADINKIVENNELVYNTFIVNTDTQTHKIDFNSKYPGEMTKDEALAASYDILEQEDNNIKLYKVNPTIFSSLTYKCVVKPDILQPRSEELERALKLDIYREAIQNPNIDPVKATEDFLLGAYKDIKNPKDYLKSAQMDMMDPNYVPGQAEANNLQKEQSQILDQAQKQSALQINK